MHPLHDFIANQIAQHLKSNTVVVLYDRHGELKPFFAEAGADPSVGGRLEQIRFGETPANFTAFAGSFLETRLTIEEATGGDDPARTLIYVPDTVWDEQGSLLMEVEKAGYLYRPALKQMARIVLKQRFNDVQIDEIVKSDAVSYDDLARIASASAEGESASILRGIFDNTSDAIAIIVRWVRGDHADQAIQDKGAFPELRKLLAVKVGLSLPDDASLARLRSVTQRHILGSEFLLDTKSTTITLPGVSAPTSRDQIDAVRAVAERLRKDNADIYEDIANLVQGELGIDDLGIEGDAFGAIDTFKIEEFLVVAHCFKLIAARRFADARAIIDERRGSFWIERSQERSAVWQACRLMTDLGLVAGEVQSTIAKANGTVKIWVDRYTDANGWHRLDRAQRELETVVQSCEEHIDEQALGIVRQVYEETAARMAEGFVKALAKSDWVVPGVIPQSRVYADCVAGSPKPVAYILVDAMRYEMGVELSARIAKVATEQKLRHAVASLPSITPVCMAALQPGAAASFSVVDRNGKLGAEVDGTFLSDLKARQLFAKGRLPGSIDLTLDNVLQGTTKALASKIAGASVILVRSQEIDEAGEGATSFARRMMAGVIEDLARCLTKLAGAGVEHAVIVADHGHLFFAHDRDESMRIDAPGGAQVDLHRRCWIGHGGATPPGTVRVPASKLGYQSDLDLVLPVGTGVFRSGGDLAYHHGGASLQELIVPVLTVRLKADKSGTNAKNQVEVQHDAAITNRIFTVRVSLGTTLFSAERPIRVVAVHAGRQVATIGMADMPKAADGTIRLEPRKTVSVGFLLTDEEVKTLNVQVLDGETDAILYQSKDLPVRLGV